ncbi:methionine adenosyltransferase [Candidatus Parvarchaeota archaeon]|jgi:S-adenosylmethionine synthetase|nr:methionine adenosyltransferase [Candidatus Parvarchaeota archaeon]
MNKNITIYRSHTTPIEKQKVEIVERKGLGHPDFMADSISETFSRNLSRYYLSNFNRILHHNVDKLEVIGGETSPKFGGGKVIKPISILFSGRATSAFEGKTIPVEDIAIDSSKMWLKDNMRFLDPEGVRYIFETKSGSANLSSAFDRKGKIGSNDTSFGVGYAPLSDAEKTVLEIEKFTNSKSFKDKFPFSGEDVKVMCVRRGNKIEITMAMAFVDRYINSVSDYFDKKSAVLVELNKKFEFTELNRKIKISLNGMDSKKLGLSGCYLTVTGSSAEHGDDGAVGRGNRANGLITPNRPMSLEATAGKNPVNHIGKIYNLFSIELSKRLYELYNVAVNVRTVGRIGRPLEEPLVLSIETTNKIDYDIKKRMLSTIGEELSNIKDITDKLLNNKLSVC